MQRHKILILSFFLFVFLNVGCLTPIKEWVEKRNYTFYRDYSTINILGYVVHNGQLRSNPYFAIVSKKGSIPDIIRKKQRMFKIEGSTEIEHFLSSITEGKITGKFEISKKAEITLKKPFKEEALAFIPLNPCYDRKMLLITKVLNTGSMTVKIEDDKGINITSTFKPKKIIDAGAEVQIEFGNELTISGKDFYVGYSAELKRCVNVIEKEIAIMKGVEHIDDEIGICAFLSEIKEEGDMQEALIYISPSNFIGYEAAHSGIKMLKDKEMEWRDMVLRKDPKALDYSPWAYAVNTSAPLVQELRSFTETQKYKVKFGDHFGIPGIPRKSGLYIEVHSVNKEEQIVKLKVQHVRYEDVKK